eukprot:m.98814 g.98814  ORF g.98814 m.98814 type:complete len:125 (-) comp15298_c0_seq3:204-578(-)
MTQGRLHQTTFQSPSRCFFFEVGPVTLEELLESQLMQGLTAWGSGMFEIGNSMNHSCEPSAISVTCEETFALRMVATRDVRAGEELCISYIDETEPLGKRQQRLRDMYLFDCDCDKCAREGGTA